MAPDLLSTICREIEERLSELRPLLVEHEQLLVAADALLAPDGGEESLAASGTAMPVNARRGAQARPRRRGSAAGAIKRAGTDPTAVVEEPVAEESAESLDAAAVRRSAKTSKPAAKPKPERAARGAAREAILAALDHGSHTVGELAIVTAMSGPNINGNLRRLFSEGAVVKTEREGKAAWALVDAAV
jgi:DNA-binding transcriptional ArsR family regulator